jgi:hypothetical protein
MVILLIKGLSNIEYWGSVITTDWIVFRLTHELFLIVLDLRGTMSTGEVLSLMTQTTLPLLQTVRNTLVVSIAAVDKKERKAMITILTLV